MRVTAWTVHGLAEPMIQDTRDEQPGAGEVLVEVAGCGVCHTDLGFYYDGVPTRHALPLTLGHEISGHVIAAGAGAEEWLGEDVVVPAVLPCGECEACRAGHGSICAAQIFPGNDVHGGFATHARLPARGLCGVPDLGNAIANPGGLELSALSVIADAVTTPYQAILRSDLQTDDLAIFVGTGGVGGFGVQIAAAMGAHVVAIDVDPQRLAVVGEYGASLTLSPAELEFRELRRRLRAFASEHGVPSWRRRVFETSGTPQGQATAFGLLEPGALLCVVGFTPRKVELRFSNIMALDATVQGNWGCLPEHYPAVLEMVLTGRVALKPFIEQRPLSSINETFADLHDHRVGRRVILIPEH